MRRLQAALTLTAALAAPFAAYAACESGLAERMQSRLYPERTLERPLAACKSWSVYAGRSVVVLPFLVDPAQADGQRDFDLAVLVIQRPDNGNTERDAVLAQLYQPSAIRERGAPLQELRIDTSRYLLAPEQRAFGLRARYRAEDLAAPYAAESLRLYLPQDTRIHPLLAETEVERDSGRWDLQCEGRFERVRTQISVEPRAGQRWSDLLLSRTLISTRAQRQADGSCVDRAAPARSVPVRLRHDGQQYPLPAALKWAP